MLHLSPLSFPPALLLCSVCATATAAAAATATAGGGGWRQSQFVVGGGPDPPPTASSYNNLAGAGVTFVHADTDEVTSVAAAKTMALLCAANNLSCALPLVAAGTIPPNGRSVWGYFVRDEPKGRDFPGLASQVAGIRKTHPTALSFINLLGYANMSAEATLSLCVPFVL